MAAIPAELGWLIAASYVFVLATSLLVPTLILRVNEFVTQDKGAAAALYTLTLFTGASVGVVIGQVSATIGLPAFALAVASVYALGLIVFVRLDRISVPDIRSVDA